MRTGIHPRIKSEGMLRSRTLGPRAVKPSAFVLKIV